MHPYNYKPAPIFRGVRYGRTYLGVELELNGDEDKILETVQEFDGDERVCYCKYDSTCSVELNFHPRTLRSWKEYSDRLEDLLGGLREHCDSVEETPNIGVHIHASKKWIKRTQVLKIVRLIQANEHTFFYLSRRVNRGSFNHWSWVPKSYEEAKDVAKERYDRCCVTPRGKTIEFRLFQSTTKPEILMEYLELVDALIGWSRETSLMDCTDFLGFCRFLWDHRGTYRNLMRRLKEIAEIMRKEEAAA